MTHSNDMKSWLVNLPGSFFVLKDAFVIIDLLTGVVLALGGDSGTLIPIGTSAACPATHKPKIYNILILLDFQIVYLLLQSGKNF